MKHRCVLLCIFVALPGLWSPIAAQNPSDKGSYIDSLGRYYQRADLPVFMFIATSPFEQEPARLNPLNSKGTAAKPAPMYLNGPGKHVLTHHDAVNNTEMAFVIYADGAAPVSTASFASSGTSKMAGKTFYAAGLSVSLAAKDELSGLRALTYSTSAGEAGAYKKPVVFSKEGEFTVVHYATDNVGNQEAKQTHMFTIDSTSPQTFHTVAGIAQDYIVAPSSRMHLTHSDNLSGVAKTFYKFDTTAFKLYGGATGVPFMALNDGEHMLTYYSIDNVGNREPEKTFRFYYDKTAPLVATDVLGDKFITPDGRIYFSGRTKLKLTSIDNKAGVKETRYSIDFGPFQRYIDPFYLPSKSGLHDIRYYAVDDVPDGNSSSDIGTYRHNSSKIHVDITGPLLSNAFVGKQFLTRDTLFVSPLTKISLAATDSEAGLQRLAYSIDGAQAETPYALPFEIAKAGPHKIEVFGYDNVNNRNTKGFYCTVDAVVPQIFANFSASPSAREVELNVYPVYTSLFLAATDLKTGVDGIFYSLDGLPEKPYAAPLTGFVRDKQHSVRIRAVDKVGNEAVAEVKFWVR